MSHPNRRLKIKDSSIIAQTTWLLPFHTCCYARLGLLLCGLTALSACAATDARSIESDAGSKTVAVAIATVTQKTLPLEVRSTGAAEPYSTVSVKSQVEGQLTNVYFQQGQDVKKGELLFKIDSRSLQAALRQAEANQRKDLALLAQAQANLAKAKAQVNQAQATVVKDIAQAKNNAVQAQRYQSLYVQGAVNKQQAEQYTTSAATQQATVAADRDAVANAVAGVEAAKAYIANAQAALSADAAAIDNAYVYVVKPNKTLELRSVVAGNTVGNETAIKQGLKPGEQVVIDGQFNLVPKAKVAVK